MRLIGISMKRIALLYLVQNSIAGAVAVLLALLLSHTCLTLMSRFVATMGIVLTAWRAYPLEWAIAGVVFAISVLPTMIAILRMSSRESL